MKKFVATVAALVLAATVYAGPKSGPQVGETVPGPFHPTNLTGPSAGEDSCLYCRYGAQPVAMVFARSQTPAVAKLVKELDAACAKDETKKLASFVTYLSDCKDMCAQAKEMAKTEGIKHVVLSNMKEAPEGYQVAKEADVTVVLYVKGKVQANHSFEAGKLDDQAVAAVVADLGKICK